MPIYKKKTINNTPTKIPLSAPQGYPVGTIIMRYKKICPRNCVYLDGRDTTGTAEELETVYPALYMFLGGTNVLPDYRECAMVGAEQNTTDTIATHDVYTEGQFKDDQIQELNTKTDLNVRGDYTTHGQGNVANVATEGSYDATITNARQGTTTHGKQKAVYYYMVAVEGCMIADEDDFINVIKAYIDSTQSYSTTETNTGKKWIDGKTIYKKTYVLSGTVNDQYHSDVGITEPANIDKLLDYEIKGNNFSKMCYLGDSVNTYKMACFIISSLDVTGMTCTLEYTKTT